MSAAPQEETPRPATDEPSTAGVARALQGMQPRLTLLADEVRQADLRNIRTLTADRDGQRTVALASMAVALQLTAEARQLVRDLQQACEHTPPPERTPLPPTFLTFPFAVDAVLGATREEPTQTAFADVSFLVELELRQRHERLTRVAQVTDPLALIGECEGALRRIRKGLGALDAALAPWVGGQRVLDFRTELQESLLVRRAYARLRRFFAAAGEPTPAGVGDFLPAATSHLAALLEGPVAPLLRVEDRLQFVALLSRLQDWVRSAPARNPVAGVRLWQDAAAFVQMLTLVNRRQELVQHDVAIVGRLAGVPGAAPPESDEARRHLLASLEGLDDELDALLGPDHAPEAQRQAVQRLARRLGVPTSDAAGDPP